MNTPDANTLVTSLRSPLCPACGGAKKKRQTFCLGCYKKLPMKLQYAVYDNLGDGYEEAVAESLCALGATEFLLENA